MPDTFFEERRGDFLVSTDPARLQVDVIHHFLANDAFWATGIGRETVETAIRHSLCFGLFHDQAQIGFARVITDFATYAYLNDVFVLPAYRNQGLASWLMECVVAHPALQTIRRFGLTTRDKQSFYRRFGFHSLLNPDRHMEKLSPEFYTAVSTTSAPH
ncbi:MAG: GNAT family N-acetyltransferase [Chloroflexi bacterium]|nr:GNAT family N-acetyltransferase [Chloroflexota bacterium]MCI0576062.1 GNAT family N-acetyltransferase [Chloroflexota bacterium]MCI0647850.1 GNAT family N-acetyltransferase [Chloroflexota bacterium]MCI0727101.1 GNAT family N-acetyltransferase [Chloroflexota bacterium]